MLGFGGLIVIKLSVASDTVNETTPTIPENVAVIVTAPGAIPSAWPNDPRTLLMVASDAFDEVHSTEFVRFWVVPSVRVPVAVKAIAVPAATVPLADLIVIAVNASTVKLAVALTPFNWQVIVTEPVDNPAVTIPIELTVATLEAEDDQVATVSIC
jgi:hypothetical protein